MNKSEFITRLSENAGMTKKATEKYLDAVFDTIIEVLNAGEQVQLTGFGTFEAKKRPSHIVQHPKTGLCFLTDETIQPVFRPGKTFRDKLNKRREKIDEA